MLLVDFLKGADRVLADKGKTTPGCRLPGCILLTGSPYWFFAMIFLGISFSSYTFLVLWIRPGYPRISRRTLLVRIGVNW